MQASYLFIVTSRRRFQVFWGGRRFFLPEERSSHEMLREAGLVAPIGGRQPQRRSYLERDEVIAGFPRQARAHFAGRGEPANGRLARELTHREIAGERLQIRATRAHRDDSHDELAGGVVVPHAGVSKRAHRPGDSQRARVRRDGKERIASKRRFGIRRRGRRSGRRCGCGR